MAISDIKNALEKVKASAGALLTAVDGASDDLDALQKRADSVQDCINKKNAELVEVGMRTDAANAEATVAEGKLEQVRIALEAYKAAVRG